jgi:serine/threonine protein kinase
MHSLGVMTAVLLTGVSYWPESDSPDESKAASSCESILRRLGNNEEEWRDVGYRAKDFVKRLIVADSKKRMTARQALKHHWFTNEAHRGSFERLYERAIKNWQPKARCSNIIEDIDLTTPRQDIIVSSTEGIPPSYFKVPCKVLPGITRATYGTLLPSVSEENESPSDSSEREPHTAPTAIMYVTRGSNQSTSGPISALKQLNASDKATRKHETHHNIIKQTLQELQKRSHPGCQDDRIRTYKRAKKQTTTRGSQGIARLWAPATGN